MSKAPIGIGVIGTGFGVRVQLPVWSKTEGARVVAVCSHDLPRARQVAERFGLPHAVTDPAELAALPDVDLVSVATPPHQHHEGVMAALAAGKHVLCEKPFALDAAQGRAMLEAAKTRGVLHFTNFEFRRAPARATMRRMVREGAIGELAHVHVTAFTDVVRITEGKTARWWYEARSGGGWLGAAAPHTIDALRDLFGELTGVLGQLHTVVKEHRTRAGEMVRPDVDDTFFFLFRLAGGALGAYLSGAAIAAGGAPMRLEAYGTRGTLVLDGDTLLAGKSGARSLEPVPVGGDAPAPSADPHYGPFLAWTRDIVAAVRQDRQIAPTFEDGWRSQLVLDAVRRSAHEGRWVDVAG